MTSPLTGRDPSPTPRLPVLMLWMHSLMLWMLQAPRKAPFAQLAKIHKI